MNIKKQVRVLHLYNGFLSFRIIDAVWVIFLLARGYSLTQVGAAEAVYHITGLIFEIPSGMAADLFGRKMTLVYAQIAGTLSGLCIGFGGNAAWIYLGMFFSSICGSLVSGTFEAILYDSLLEVQKEEDYKGILSKTYVIGRVLQATGCLMTPISIAAGNTKTYVATSLIAFTGACMGMLLKEPKIHDKRNVNRQKGMDNFIEMWKTHISETFLFIREHPKTMCKLLADAAVACPCYLTLMYLQQQLTDHGWPAEYIGLPIFLIPLAGALGNYMASKINSSLFRTVLICGIAGGIGTCMAGADLIPLMIIGAVVSHICCGITEIMVSESSNRDFPSRQRATMVSVAGMMYSLLMIAASMMTGMVGEQVSMKAMFCMLGGILAVSTPVLCLAARVGFRKR